MKEEFVVKNQRFTDKLFEKLSFTQEKDKRKIEKLIVTDKDIIIEIIDINGLNKKIIIPINGIVTHINESDFSIINKMIKIEYINHLGINKFCSFYPNFVSNKDKIRLIKTFKCIGIIQIDLSVE